MRKTLLWTTALLLTTLTAFFAWRYYVSTRFEVAPPPAPLPQETPQAQRPEPEIAHPLVAEEAPAVATTTVDDSDTLFSRFVNGLFKASQLPDFIYPDKMLRRFVATVDNLPRKEIAVRIRPVKPAPGMFEVEKDDTGLRIAPANAARYERYVRALESIDTAAAVKFYATHYALFERAYQDLGYPKGRFNDRLFEAIDDLLATPQMREPVALVQPKVLYRFADPDLENRSAGQKIMLRMGPANAARVKTVLTAVRAELERYAKPR